MSDTGSDSEVEGGYDSQDGFDISKWGKSSIDIAQSQKIIDLEDLNSSNRDCSSDKTIAKLCRNDVNDRMYSTNPTNKAKWQVARDEQHTDTGSATGQQVENQTTLSAIERLRAILSPKEGKSVSIIAIDEALAYARDALEQQMKKRDELKQEIAELDEEINDFRQLIKQAESYRQVLASPDEASSAIKATSYRRRSGRLLSLANTRPISNTALVVENNVLTDQATCMTPLNVSYIASLVDEVDPRYPLEPSMDTKEMLYAIIQKVAEETDKIDMWESFFNSRQRRENLNWDKIVDIFFTADGKPERDGQKAEQWYIRFCESRNQLKDKNKFMGTPGFNKDWKFVLSVNSCSGKLGKLFHRKGYKNIMAAILVKLYEALEAENKPPLAEKIWNLAKPCFDQSWHVWCRRLSLPKQYCTKFPGALRGENNTDNAFEYAKQRKNRKRYKLGN